MNETRLNRRDFLKVIGTAGASLVIGIYLGGCNNDDETQNQLGPSDSQATAYAELPSDSYFIPNIHLTIDNTNKLTITAFRSEMGQGITTAIAMILADELEADWDRIELLQALGDERYTDFSEAQRVRSVELAADRG